MGAANGNGQAGYETILQDSYQAGATAASIIAEPNASGTDRALRVEAALLPAAEELRKAGQYRVGNAPDEKTDIARQLALQYGLTMTRLGEAALRGAAGDAEAEASTYVAYKTSQKEELKASRQYLVGGLRALKSAEDFIGAAETRAYLARAHAMRANWRGRVAKYYHVVRLGGVALHEGTRFHGRNMVYVGGLAVRSFFAVFSRGVAAWSVRGRPYGDLTQPSTKPRLIADLAAPYVNPRKNIQEEEGSL